MSGKSLHRCCVRLKRPSPSAPPQSQNSFHVPSSSASVFKNFNSLYDPAAASDAETLTGFGSGSTSQTLTSTVTTADGDDVASDSEPDLSTVFASRRLLRPASTGRSKSIVEGGEGGPARAGFGAVPKLSPDPYGDFKRSMEEMVAALGLVEGAGGVHQQPRRQRGGPLSGAHQLRLQELLLCYLALNRQSEHKYIVGAFADVLRGLSANGN